VEGSVTTGRGQVSFGSYTLDKCLLYELGAFHREGSPLKSMSAPMRKLPTGEPCAGEPQARFGGQGGEVSLSTSTFILPTYFFPSSYYLFSFFLFSSSALRIFSGVMGMSVILTPTASYMALAMHPALGFVRPSPASFAPKGPSGS